MLHSTEGGGEVLLYSIKGIGLMELNRMSRSSNQQVLHDFNYYAEAIAETIKKAGYSLVTTESKYIEVKFNNGTYKIYDPLTKGDNIAGYLFSDGIKQPKIEYGVKTDIDILIALRDFKK